MSTSFSERSPLKFLSTPSARRATGGIVPGDITVKFLSTPSARRATIFTRSKITNTFFSIHALREEGDTRRDCQCRSEAISIHALREEGDADGPSGLRAGIISIHALREEGDPSKAKPPKKAGDFYPRPPRGGRHAANKSLIGSNPFLSTPSARRATCSICSSPW